MRIHVSYIMGFFDFPFASHISLFFLVIIAEATMCSSEGTFDAFRTVRFIAFMDVIATFALVFIADERFALLPVVRFMAFVAIAYGNKRLRWLPGENNWDWRKRRRGAPK